MNKMKKQLPKIAIKYSEENWPEIKKAVDYLRGKGLKIIKRKDDCHVKSGSAKSLILDSEWDYFNAEYSVFESFQDTDAVLHMPADFEKLKSYFEEEPKRGEVYFIEQRFNNRKVLVRITGEIVRDEDGENFVCYSYFYTWEKQFSNPAMHAQFQYIGDDVVCYRKATPEEEAKLIKAEHDNGYHWDGKEFVKIPEYVEVVRCINPKHWYKNHIGDVFKVFGVSKFIDGWSFETTEIGYKGIIIECCKPSTKEAYEAQQKLKQHKTPSEAINSPKRLTKQVEKLEKRVIELKELNEFQASRIKELEDNNGKLFEMARVARKAVREIASQPEIIEQVKKMITE